MPDPNRSRNPVQRIQGYVERYEPVTINTTPPQIITVQKSYPGAKVEVLLRKPDGVDTEFARIFNRDGSPSANPFTLLSDTAFYSFYAQPGRYDIRFTDPNNGFAEIMLLKDVPVESLVFNIRDYGAKGDGVTDDTAAIRNALKTMIAANTTTDGVGTLFFPNGRYKVTMTGGPFELPSGILVQGANSQYSGDGPEGNCQIILASENQSIFFIGSSRYKISIRDIGLTTDGVGALAGTKAIEAAGTSAVGNATQIEFHNLTIWGFDKGISVEGDNGSDQWDFTNVRVNQCMIGECNYGIWLNSENCDFWKIVDSRIGAYPGGHGIHLRKVGIISFDGVLGAGNVPGMKGDTFIYMTAQHGTVTINGCECEGFFNSMEVVGGPNLEANITWPILVLNSTFGNPILLKSNCDYVSIANRYLPLTVKCVEAGTDVMIYSFGDIFAGNNDPIPVDNRDYDFQLIGNSRVAERANRFRVDFQRPTRIGGQAGQPASTLNDIPLAVSAFGANQTQLALCDPAGVPLFNIRADENGLHFEEPFADEKLMQLGFNGNLHIKGKLFENSLP